MNTLVFVFTSVGVIKRSYDRILQNEKITDNSKKTG